ncbi:MAG: phenylacetate--CoA ligase family protein [Acidobacteriota bacterium]
MSPEHIDSAPDLFSYFSRWVVAPAWARKEKSPYLRHLKTLVRSPYRSGEEVRRDQSARLKTLLERAASKSPFYRDRFRACGFVSGDMNGLDGLSALPLLTKDDIRANLDAMLVEDARADNLLSMTTSGSTGVSLKLHMDEDSRQWKRACAIRHDMWTGWRLGESVGAVWGNPESAKNWRLALRNLLLSRNIPLDTLRMDEAAMSRFNHLLTLKRPTMLFGHAHSLYLFARFVAKHSLATVRPKGVVSTAMVLHDFERKTIEEVFQAKVFNRYGCEEVSLIASECEAHEGLHVNQDTLIVEVVDARGMPVPPGTPGAVVVTDLTNLVMPVIRYKVGDVAVLKEERCSCGRSYPLLSSLEGRIADYVRTPSGEYISGISLTENFAMELEGVKQLQIVQDRIDHLVFRMVANESGGGPQLEQLSSLVSARFGDSMGYDVEMVQSIQSERSGKYRFCISMLNDTPF